jgi:hypothetical protein
VTKKRSSRRPPREVFLSHATKDRRAATQLAAWLRDRGVPVWFSRTHLVGAQQWHDEIGRALDHCDWFMVLLSPHSIVSKWVKHEFLAAISERKFDGRILPILLKPCAVKKLSWTLPAIQMIDFSIRTEETREMILRALHRPRRRSRTPGKNG